jgi:hypothetical protein
MMGGENVDFWENMPEKNANTRSRTVAGVERQFRGARNRAGDRGLEHGPDSGFADRRGGWVLGLRGEFADEEVN